MQTSTKPQQWRYTVDEKTGCWLWRGGLTANGYPIWNRNGGERTAHREFYVLNVGPIPTGHHLHHECGTKLCVNPAHLIPVTIGEHNRIEAPFAAREEHARELRKSGLSYVRIAAELGCSRTTAYRLVNPESKESHLRYKRERPEHYRELRVAHYQRLKAQTAMQCVECGAPMDPRRKTPGICIACRQERSQKRKQEIQRLWNEGRSLSEIARELKTTRASVGARMNEMRQEGWELPLRYHMQDLERRLSRGRRPNPSG